MASTAVRYPTPQRVDGSTQHTSVEVTDPLLCPPELVVVTRVSRPCICLCWGGVLAPRRLASPQSLSCAKQHVFCVNRFYPKTQLSWLARLDHSHCNSADPLTDGLEVCCVFYRPGPGGAMCVVWWWKVLESRGRGDVLHPDDSSSAWRAIGSCCARGRRGVSLLTH